MLSDQARKRAREGFESALDASAPAYEIGQLSLFVEEDERFIRKEVERKLYDPELPNAGGKERRVIERLKRLSRDHEWEGHGRAANAIRFWQELLPDDPRNAGCYYVRKRLTPKANKDEWKYYDYLKQVSKASKQWDRKWFAELMLEGLPEAVSDFEMECLFLLRRSDGTVSRLVRLRNVVGEISQGEHHEGSVLLDDESFRSPEKFRGWCLKWGNFAWLGNQTDLHQLHLDINRYSAWRVINQVDSVGWLKVKRKAESPCGRPPNQKSEEPSPQPSSPGEGAGRKLQSGIWFCDECAYADGRLLKPDDDDGIYWWQGEGYYLNQRGREVDFVQGRPKMRPELTLQKALKSNRPELELIRDLFTNICANFHDALGGYEGWLALGSIFAYAAAPEIFAQYALFPGLFVHGQMGSGKTNLVSWLVSIQGLDLDSGISLLEGTAVGLLTQTENYSNVAIWADEYRGAQIPEEKEAVLRDAYNRQSPVKWSPDGKQRKMRTNFIVSGESTSSDSAMRSRYVHIQISKANRIGDQMKWMGDNKALFFILGRTLLQRRGQFVELFQKNFEEWNVSPVTRVITDRQRMVHGIAWAAWESFMQLLGAAHEGVPERWTHTSDQSAGFMAFIIKHATSSSEDVSNETNINVFWDCLLNAWKADAIPVSCFRVESDYATHPPGWPGQNGGWQSYRLYIDPGPTISALQMHLAKERSQLALKRMDLRDQLSKNAYWIAGKLTKRFGPNGDMTSVKCWGFNMDTHPLGRQDATDKEYQNFMLHPDEPDPRKGPLFTLIYGIVKLQDAHK